MILVNEVEEKPIEFLEKEKFNTDDEKLNNAMRAAEAHRRIRYNLQKMLKPGVSLKKVVDYVEESTRIMLKGEKNNGIGFPCGISLNDVAAHFTLNPWDDDILLKETDILKIDYGTHSDGQIIDSAFTVCFDEKYTNLLKASKEAIETGIKSIGIDSYVCEIGRDISEIFGSYEVEDEKGIMKRIRPVWNLNGHSIDQFTIHSGITIPPINNGDYSKVKEGFVAVEVFTTTGRGKVEDVGECSHYMLNKNCKNKIYSEKSEQVLNLIKKEFGTLPFSPKHLDFYRKDCKTAVQLLAARKFVTSYPPLADVANSKVAQFEHTIYLKETSKTVVSRGEDY
ncbi:hypothetical protein NUSPORA_00056 [Nucleospora cyclopteri]